MPATDSIGKFPLRGLLLVFLALVVGIGAAGTGNSSTLIALLLGAAGGVGLLWQLQQSRQHREKFLAMQALRGSEARYRAVVDSANDAIVTFNPAGEIAGWNAAAERIFHYTATEVMGQPVQRILPRSGHDHFLAELQRIQAGGSPLILGKVVELAGQRRDGTVFPMELSVAEWSVSGARFFTGTMRDITERKHAEVTLRLQSTALTAAANGIVITNRDGAVLWVNPAFTTMTGYTIAEAVGKNPRDLVKSGRHERAVYDEMWATILAGHVWHGQLVNRRKDGSFYPEEQTITPVRGAAGEITHFIAIKHDLTKRQQVEAARRESELRFKDLFDHAPVGYHELDAEGRITRINETELKMLGYTAEELLGQFVWMLVQDEASSRRAVLAKLRGELPSPAYERMFRRKDGSTFPVLLETRMLKNDDGTIRGVRTIVQDITERKRAEKDLQLFRTLVDQSNDTVEVIDPETSRFLDVNAKGPAELGCSRAEYLSLRVVDIDPTIPEAAWPDVAAKVRAAGSLSGEGLHRRKDGTTFPIEFSAKFVRLDRDYFVTVVRDITERKRAEAALRHSEERHRLLFENNPLPVWLYDVETLGFLAVNESAVQHYGFTRDEFLHLTLKEIRPPEDIPALLKSVADARTQGQSFAEARHRRKDGTVIHVEIFSRPLIFDGRAARLVIAADVTEKKLLEEKFLHAQRLESLGMLAAGIAHDLNNTLAPIMFAAPMLRESLTSGRDLQILTMLERSAERGAGLVKQILAFVHSSTGEPRPTQVKHLARDITSMIEETFPKSIRLEQQIPSDLWPVLANPTQIHQVLLNLCVNARDAMPHGGTLRITLANRQLAVGQARSGEWLVIEIADTGTGMAPDALTHLWEPFFTTKGGKGTGLGLSTVRAIVTSHRGHIDVDTELGRGTTFRVFLPAIEHESRGAVAAPTLRRLAGHGELVLVVDDEPGVRDIVAAILAKHGFRVLSAGDGVEAVAHFTAHAPEIALVISDVDMPLFSGAVLARVLLQLRPDLRLLAMSGLSQGETADSDIEAIKKLAQAFLPKPFTAEGLLDAVDRLLTASPRI